MKKLKALVLLMILGVILLAGCSIDPTIESDLVGTTWEYALAGTGFGVRFDTATTGTEYALVLGVEAEIDTFTYTYDGATLTGIIDYDSYSYTSEFEISADGTTLDHEDYPSVTFEYKPFGRDVE